MKKFNFRFVVFAEKTGILPTTFLHIVEGQTLSRSYGRCIAEFLSEGSLVRLWSTRPEHLCRFAVRSTTVISQQTFLVSSAHVNLNSEELISFALRTNPRRLDSHTIRLLSLPCRASADNTVAGTGILTRCPSPTLRASA